MNWEVISTVAEIVGAIAVVLTLLYLAIQIRQSNKVAKSSVRQAIAESAQSLTDDLINNNEMAEIFVKHVNGDRLDPVESLRLQGRCYRDMQHWENIHYQLREGLLSEEDWFGFRKNLVALFELEAYRDYWRNEHSLYSKSYQDEINSILDSLNDLQSGAKISERFKRERVLE